MFILLAPKYTCYLHTGALEAPQLGGIPENELAKDAGFACASLLQLWDRGWARSSGFVGCCCFFLMLNGRTLFLFCFLQNPPSAL